MNARMELCFPLGSEMMTTVRLTTGGMCALAGLDLDTSEDCKVCVTESLLLLLHRGFREARVVFSEENGLRVAVKGEGERKEAQESAEDDISLALLGALAGEVAEEKREGVLVALSFRFESK